MQYMRSHAIAATLQRSQTFMSMTVRVLENTSGTRSGTESLPEVFLQDNCEQIDYHYFFRLSHKQEMRSGTHFTQQNVFLPVVDNRRRL
jgi:hypothetical protein